jgi:hypothetical protein
MQVGSDSTFSIPILLTDAFSSTWSFGDSIISCRQTLHSRVNPFTLTDASASTWPFGDSIRSCRWGQTVHSTSPSHSQMPFHSPGLLENLICHADEVKQYILHTVHAFTLTDAFSSTWPFGDSIMSCRWGQIVHSPSPSHSQMPFQFSFTCPFGDSIM